LLFGQALSREVVEVWSSTQLPFLTPGFSLFATRLRILVAKKGSAGSHYVCQHES